MDLESAAADLYGGSPDDFVGRRKVLVTEARAAKDRPLATAIGALRRPTRSAWLVNLYARDAAEELTALLELGAQLQEAQTSRDGAALRRLSTERHRALAAATRRAAALGEERGYTATDAVRQEVTATLQAALADADVAERVRTGTVAEAHTYGGFGPLGGGPATDETDLSAALAAMAGGAKRAGEEDADAERAEAELAARRAEAEQALNEAEAALGTAADEAEEADDRVRELTDQLATARAEAAAASQRVTEATEQVRVAREAYEAL